MPPIIIVIAPIIIGNIKNWNESCAIITTIVFPPAGGCVIFKAIISKTEMPTAKPITKKKTDLSNHVAEILAKKALEKKITKVYFDRGRYKYHGRIKTFAAALRKGGLIF